MRARFVVAVGFIALAPAVAMAAACIGKVASVYVEMDTSVYFNIQPTGECGCNHIYMGKKVFIASTQPNKKEQYAALLTAYASNSDVQVWYDWGNGNGSAPCTSWNVSLKR